MKYKIMMATEQMVPVKHFMTGFDTLEEAQRTFQTFGGCCTDNQCNVWNLLVMEDNQASGVNSWNAEYDWEFEYDHVISGQTMERCCFRALGQEEYARVVGILKAYPNKYRFVKARLLYHTRMSEVFNLNLL